MALYGMNSMQLVAILATYNEERFVANCVRNLVAQGASIYLIDNESTDATIRHVRETAGNALLGVESFPRHGIYSWQPILERKEQIANRIEADWLMHVDADEIHLPPLGSPTLAHAFQEAEEAGHNVANFAEFTFIPVAESPNHDHGNYLDTMRWYYPFKSAEMHLMRAWKRQPADVTFAWSGGHQVRFPGLNVDQRFFRIKHYMFVSVDQLVEKYVQRRYDKREVRNGWHGWRATLRREKILLPLASQLRRTISDDGLDASDPRTTHYLADLWQPASGGLTV
jgi:glycosyltransferase involved in cell wall biosynthesis